MHPALSGALTGLVVALVMIAVDYMMLRKRAVERTQRQHKKVVEFDQSEKGQMIALLRYCIFLPAGFAALFWAFA